MLCFTLQVFVLDADARVLTTFEAPGAAGDAGAARLPRPRVVALVEGKAVPQASHFTEHRRALPSAAALCRAEPPPPSPSFPPTARPTVCPLLRDIMHDDDGFAEPTLRAAAARRG